MQIAQIIADAIVAVAAAAGAVVAILGLTTWRHQLRGNTEYDLARRLLRSAYKVRDELGFVRGRVILAGEITSALQEAGLDPSTDPASREAVSAVRSRSWKYLAEALSNFDVEELEAEVLWGAQAKAATKSLHDRFGELRRATMELDLRSDTPGPDSRAERERIVELRGVVNGSSDGQDAYFVKVQDAVGQIESFLRPRLKL